MFAILFAEYALTQYIYYVIHNTYKLNPMRKILLLFVSFFLMFSVSQAQERIITGKITSSEDGLALPGVNVLLKGTTSGTVTDVNGNFSLMINDPGATLNFSFIGFLAQEIQVGTQSIINVILSPDATQLDEIVVIGYGEQSRKNVTNSIAKLDNQVLSSAPRANIASALQGTLPGLRVINTSGTPGASPLISLRGGASINSPGAPLVVVDGIIRAMNDIASEDIASIELLKDAASTAIYGARANNGVILITTKKGKSGTAQISYKFTQGFNQRRDGYQYLKAKDYIYYNRLGNLNSTRTLAQVNASRGYGLLTDAANLASFDIRAFDATTAPLLQQGWDTVGDPYNTANKIIFKDHGGEVEDLLFRNTSTTDHYLSVSGGNEKGNYFSSFDYYHEDGVIVGSSYKRFSGTINGSYKIKPNIEISSGAIMSTSSQIGTVGSEVNTLYRNLAIWPTFNPWLDVEKTKPNPGNGNTDGNPLYWLGKLQRNNGVNRITVNAGVKWDIIPGLYIKATASGYLFENLNTSFQQATQTYSQIFATVPSFNTSRNSVAYFERGFQQTYNAFANYSKTFGTSHNLNAMIGLESYGTKNYIMQVLGANAPTDDISTANASTTFAAGSNYTTESEFRINSNFGRINYDYDQKYLVGLVYRVDAVSSLAPENRTGFFPGMSAGWNVHRENFFMESSISKYISSLKPRVSYGINGNVAGIGNYDVQGVYGSQGNYNGSLGFLNTGIINSGLRWEKSKTTDIGIDLGILSDRVTIVADYFDRRTSDLLTDLTLPSYVGFSTVKTNLGTLQNKGFELAINADVLELSNGLIWNLSANATFIKNKILELPFNGNENNRQGGFQVYDPGQGKVVWVGGLQEGQPLGAIYGYKQVSIFKNDEEVAAVANTRIDRIANISGPGATFGSGKITPGDVNWLDVDKNDSIDSRDQIYLGNIIPKWTGGFSSNLLYKGFTLHARFEYALGHTIYNDLMARTLGNFQGTFNYTEEQKSAWSPTNTDTDIPKVYYADQVAAPLGKKNYTRANNAGSVLNGNNSRFYEKGDYLAIREITLSYDFPKEFLSKAKVISQARAFVSGTNLLYFTKFSGPSPEPPINPSGSINGVYAGTYPTPKTFILGIQVSF
jgi:TonB-linked SusC/RagA family outer membrane protein